MATKLLLENFHILAVFFAHLGIELGQQAVWKVGHQDVLLLLNLLVVQVRDVVDFTLLGAFLDLLVDLSFLDDVLIIDVNQILLKLRVNVLLLLLEVLELLWLVSARNDGIDTTLPIVSGLAELLLLGNLLLHHGEDFFLQLDTLLLVQFQKKVFKFALMLLINESFDGSRDLLRSHVEPHLPDHLIEGLSGHVVLLGLVVVGVVEGLLDAILQLVLLLISFFLDLLVATSTSCSELILQSLVLIFGLLSELLLNPSIYVAKFS